MTKTCDVCGAKLGFHKFRYENGYICKECYRKASKNFTETIATKSLEEVKVLCGKVEEMEIPDDSGFDVTGRIGNYVLFDDRHKKLCIIYNRINNKEMKKPEIVDFAEIKKIMLDSDPKLTKSELIEWQNSKDEEKILKYLNIELELINGDKKIITLLDSAVRAKSFASKKVIEFAVKILEKLEKESLVIDN